MKNLVIIILIFLSSTLSGIFIAVYVAEKMSNHLVLEKIRHIQRDEYSSNLKDGRFLFNYIKLIESGEHEKALNLACLQLTASVEYIDTDAYRENLKRIHEIEQFIEKVRLTENRLTKQGLCKY